MLSNEDPLPVSTVITSLSLLTLITTPAKQLLLAIPMGMQAAGSFDRIQSFLQSGGRHDQTIGLNSDLAGNQLADPMMEPMLDLTTIPEQITRGSGSSTQADSIAPAQALSTSRQSAIPGTHNNLETWNSVNEAPPRLKSFRFSRKLSFLGHSHVPTTYTELDAWDETEGWSHLDTQKPSASYSQAPLANVEPSSPNSYEKRLSRRKTTNLDRRLSTRSYSRVPMMHLESMLFPGPLLFGQNKHMTRRIPKKVGDVHFKPNCITAVTGPIGCGKSTALKALLVKYGQATTPPRLIAFCGQTPWIHEGTIRGNIIGESEFDDQRYKNVIWSCALDADIASMPAGDDTRVDSGGMGLSGGQRQRIVSLT